MVKAFILKILDNLFWFVTRPIKDMFDPDPDFQIAALVATVFAWVIGIAVTSGANPIFSYISAGVCYIVGWLLQERDDNWVIQITPVILGSWLLGILSFFIYNFAFIH